MAKYLKLEIPSPCSQNWNEMTPEKQGRFCSSCQKTVTDFTQMSDSQLLQFFKKNKEGGCGRFREDQLSTEILIPGKTIPFVKFLFQIAIPVFLFTPKAGAQKTVGRVVQKVIQEECKVGRTGRPALNMLSGRVRDELGLPVSGASVIVAGTKNGVVADSTGNFTINNVSIGERLVISSIGYATQELYISNLGNNMEVKLIREERLMGEIDLSIVLAGRMGAYISGVRVKDEQKKISEAKKDTASFLIYPNPVNVGSIIQIQNQNLKAGEYKAFVYSLDGKLMQTTEVVLPKKGQVCSLSIKWLASGNYLIQLVNRRSGKAASAQVMVTQ